MVKTLQQKDIHLKQAPAYKVKLRTAFTMIELIFAIVIISITMLTLPNVLLRDASDQEQNLVQEGILITTTKIAQILTFPWDAQSQPPGVGPFSTSQALGTNGDAELARTVVAGVNTDFRVGHFQDAMRRRMSPASAPRNASAIPAAAVNPATNISDFNDPAAVAAVVGGAALSATGFKKQYLFTNTVAYVSDTATYANTNIVFDFSTAAVAGPTSIKMVQVDTDQLDITDDPANPTTTRILQLTSFSSNIGEAEFYTRRY